MERLALILALNGALTLMVSLLAGMMLYLAILHQREQAAWHLLHAGGTGRGVMLLALAALVEFAALPSALLEAALWMIVFFVWTSMLAMATRAISGERGLRFEGGFANRLVWVSYALGTVTVFPGIALLIYGFARALWAG